MTTRHVLKIEGHAKAGRTTVRVQKQHAEGKEGKAKPEQQVNLSYHDCNRVLG
jgi:hypothetical protein